MQGMQCWSINRHLFSLLAAFGSESLRCISILHLPLYQNTKHPHQSSILKQGSHLLVRLFLSFLFYPTQFIHSTVTCVFPVEVRKLPINSHITHHLTSRHDTRKNRCRNSKSFNAAHNFWKPRHF